MSPHRTASADELTDLDDKVGQVVAFARTVCDSENPGDLIETLFSACLGQIQNMRHMGPGGNQAGILVLGEIAKLTTALAREPDAEKAGELLDAVHDSLSMEKH